MLVNKKILVSFLFLLIISNFACSSDDKSVVITEEDPLIESSLSLNIATYNIRMLTNVDQGKKAWKSRLINLKDIIQKYDFDIFGTQEGFKSQLEDILQLEEYAYVGVGRDDGVGKGEHSAIFYKSEKFKIDDQGDFWLSETPNIPSIGWDSSHKRICSWAKFIEIKTGKVFYVFNAHYDHKGKIARYQSSKLVLSKIHQIVGGNNTPVIFMGDLNAESTENTIKILSDSKYLWDSKMSTSKPAIGTEGTYHGWNLDGKTTSRIDYIFVSKTIKVNEYIVINDDIEKGDFSSDHFPVLIKVSFF